jgi:phytoene dehydrogenase-like protein
MVAEAPVVVLGGTVAALVTADLLARAGTRVELLLPARGMGGGFASLRRDAYRLDLGLRLLELGYDDAPSGAEAPIDGYRPGLHGHRPYVRLVGDYLTELAAGDLEEVEAPQLLLDGRLHDDVLLRCELSALRELLGARDAALVAAEAATVRADLGDAGVLGPHGPDLWQTTLEHASRLGHGATFHRRLIAPICEKLDRSGAQGILAALARKAWMPIFHPRTLWEGATGAPLGFRPDRRFHTISPGGTGALVDRLLERLDRPEVERRTVGRLLSAGTSGDDSALWFDDGSSIRTPRAVLATGAEELLAAVGGDYRPDRYTAAVAWAEVATDDLVADPSAVHVVDADVPLFRVSRNGHQPDPARRVLVCELPWSTTPDELEAGARAGLERAGILREGSPLRLVHGHVGPVLPAPSAANRDRFHEAHAHLERAGLSAPVLGGASALGADSLNEQIAAGHWAAHRLLEAA